MHSRAPSRFTIVNLVPNPNNPPTSVTRCRMPRVDYFLISGWGRRWNWNCRPHSIPNEYLTVRASLAPIQQPRMPHNRSNLTCRVPDASQYPQFCLLIAGLHVNAVALLCPSDYSAHGSVTIVTKDVSHPEAVACKVITFPLRSPAPKFTL